MPQKQSKKKSPKAQRGKDNSEVLDFNNPDFSFIPKGRHIYRQQGYYLICKSCELTHAVYVGEHKLMIGEDKNGEPILQDR